MTIFIVKCPGCETKYKISTEKVEPGSRIRCPKCKTIFIFKVPERFLEKESLKPEIQKVKEPSQKEMESEEKLERRPLEVPPEIQKVKEPSQKEMESEEKLERRPLEVPPGVPPEERKIHERAIRLAKILAKDIINYYKDRWEKALKEGNLREEFKKEIMESWKYYCEKIPKEIRDKTSYFQEAFNQIVGKGKKIL